MSNNDQHQSSDEEMTDREETSKSCEKQTATDTHHKKPFKHPWKLKAKKYSQYLEKENKLPYIPPPDQSQQQVNQPPTNQTFTQPQFYHPQTNVPPPQNFLQQPYVLPQQNFTQQPYVPPQQNFPQQPYVLPQQNFAQQAYVLPQQNFPYQPYVPPQQNYFHQQYAPPQQNFPQQQHAPLQQNFPHPQYTLSQQNLPHQQYTPQQQYFPQQQPIFQLQQQQQQQPGNLINPRPLPNNQEFVEQNFTPLQFQYPRKREPNERQENVKFTKIPRGYRHNLKKCVKNKENIKPYETLDDDSNESEKNENDITINNIGHLYFEYPSYKNNSVFNTRYMNLIGNNELYPEFEEQFKPEDVAAIRMLSGYLDNYEDTAVPIYLRSAEISIKRLIKRMGNYYFQYFIAPKIPGIRNTSSLNGLYGMAFFNVSTLIIYVLIGKHIVHFKVYYNSLENKFWMKVKKKNNSIASGRTIPELLENCNKSYHIYENHPLRFNFPIWPQGIIDTTSAGKVLRLKTSQERLSLWPKDISYLIFLFGIYSFIYEKMTTERGSTDMKFGQEKLNISKTIEHLKKLIEDIDTVVWKVRVEN